MRPAARAMSESRSGVSPSCQVSKKTPHASWSTLDELDSVADSVHEVRVARVERLDQEPDARVSGDLREAPQRPRTALPSPRHEFRHEGLPRDRHEAARLEPADGVQGEAPVVNPPLEYRCVRLGEVACANQTRDAEAGGADSFCSGVHPGQGDRVNGDHRVDERPIRELVLPEAYRSETRFGVRRHVLFECPVERGHLAHRAPGD